MQTWVQEEIINESAFERIHKTVSSLHAPVDVGRIPSKISSSFSGFTADQWRNWTTIFSSVALKGILPSAHLRCWLLFVRACTILCTRLINVRDIVTAEAFLVQFCRTYENLYGAKHCTPNMHMHLHLRDCLLDYGPVYAFWCFAFERYNGILGAYPTNNRAIEPQIMRKFLREQEVRCMSRPSDHPPEVESKLFKTSGSLLQSSFPVTEIVELGRLSQSNLQEIQLLSYTVKYPQVAKLCSPMFEYILTEQQAQWLRNLYSQLYPQLTIEHLSWLGHRSARAIVAGEMFSSAVSRSSKSACITAYWPNRGDSLINDSMQTARNVGIIQFFFKHKVSFTGIPTPQTHIFAYVHWYKHHSGASWFGTSAVITSTDKEAESMYSFLPLQRILGKCAHGRLSIDFTGNNLPETVSVAVPTSLRYCI